MSALVRASDSLHSVLPGTPHGSAWPHGHHALGIANIEPGPAVSDTRPVYLLWPIDICMSRRLPYQTS